MHLTSLDLFFWAAGFLANSALLGVLLFRHRERKFPFFTALIALVVVKTVILYFVLHHGSKYSYFITYWSLSLADTILQLCVVYEVASHVLRPMNSWAPEIRGTATLLLTLS